MKGGAQDLVTLHQILESPFEAVFSKLPMEAHQGYGTEHPLAAGTIPQMLLLRRGKLRWTKYYPILTISTMADRDRNAFGGKIEPDELITSNEQMMERVIQWFDE